MRRRRQRFEAFLGLLQQKMDLITNRDHPLDYIVLALPQELYQKCRSVEYVEKGAGPASTATCAGRSRRWRCSSASRPRSSLRRRLG